MTKLIIGLLSLVMAQSALADQCAWNSKTDAESAIKLLKGSDVMLWCHNCQEAKPSKIFKVLNVENQVPSKGYRQVVVNLEENVKPINIDLAYTYVRVATNVFANIAHLVGCDSTGEMTFVQTGPGRKKVPHFYDKTGTRVDMPNGAVEESEEEGLDPAKIVETVAKFNRESNRKPANKNK